MNGAEFIRNCNAFDPDELERYENQHVAWSDDGKQILAHAAELPDLIREIEKRGLTHYVLDFIPSGDAISLGGGLTDTEFP
jgi:hypothetical protein